MAVALALAVLCVFAAARLPALRATELGLLDWRLRATRPVPAADRLLIVAIEASTFETLGTWGPSALDRAAWPPAIHALADAGARAIALDVYFTPTSTGADAALAAALADAGTVIIVADATARRAQGDTESLTFRPPSPAIAKAAAGVASPLLFRPDNTVRWVRLQQTAADGSTAYPALAFAVAQAVTRGPLRVPPSSWPLMTIPWSGPMGTIRRVRFEDLCAGRVPPDQIRDRVVFVGRWDEMEDLLQTPLGPVNGVEIHAQATAALLSGRYLTPAGNTAGLLIALVLSAALALLGIRRVVWVTWLHTACAVLCWLALAYVVFRAGGVILPVTGTALSLLATGLVLSALGSERALRSLTKLWPSWVSTEAQEVEATVLVCDLAGYTSRSEQSAPGEMLELLRRFFSLVEEAVREFGGTLARRPGDAAIVLFRHEDGRPHPAARALRAALALRDRLHEAWRDTDIGFGITLTTGLVSLGFVGPEPQILGDPVNVGFRLQSECRSLDEPIIADWPTTTADPEMARLMRPLGEVEVRHRKTPVQIFAPVEEP